MADQRAESSASRPPSDSSDAVHAEPGTKPRPEGEIPEIETDDDAAAASGSDDALADGGQGDGEAVETESAERVSAADQASVESTGVEPGSAKSETAKSERVDERADAGSAEPESPETGNSGPPEDDPTSTDRGESDPAARVDPQASGAESAEPVAADSEHVDSEHVDSERADRPAEASASGITDHEGTDSIERTDNVERTGPSDPDAGQRPSYHPHPTAPAFDPMRADTLTMHAVATEAGRAEDDDDPQARRRRRIRLTSILAAATFGLAGFLAVTSAVNAKGTDLRAERQTDVADLARAQLRTNRELDARLAELRGEVDELLARQLRNDNAGAAQKKVDELAPAAGLTPLVGPGVTVVLDDAPPSVRSDDTDPDALVVHQQDIQAVVNAMWAGGAEAMMIQGQRVISTSAIRCVGNSVVLHGVPYPPPYRIEAIGNVGSMVQAINDSPAVNTYLEYVADPRYRLGWQLDRSGQLHVPAFEGSLKLDHAEERDVSPGQDSDD
ncbi:DUF881 domain-containing protein [Actinopolymorpha pittospori]|uniref:Uncharacterized protein YlxW (UPF0749 family) n=1 Tax=Actinopolymorpha pittospori TaxID=648752 RepID=A0A927RHB7_9ACTN|nr:uncharacterized protein YlxW (UPF0749 family) [Actinopolymorpha pittospori]